MPVSACVRISSLFSLAILAVLASFHWHSASVLAAGVHGTLVRVANIYLSPDKNSTKLAEIERGREGIVDFLQQSNFPELVSKSSEIAFLDEWLEEVKAKRPLSKLEVMQREMETAIAKELYERAAELRDAIRLLKTQKRA